MAATERINIIPYKNGTDEVDMYEQHLKMHSALDEVQTSNLSQIKEISKRINFAHISSSQQVLDNKGDAYYKLKVDDIGDYYENLTLSYTIQPKETGVVYGSFQSEKDKDGNRKTSFNADTFNNYARFIVDLITQKVIYSHKTESFVIVKKNHYKIVDDVTFALEYPVENKKRRINDFLDVMIELYKDVLKDVTHDYKIFPHTFAGEDWIYDCKTLTFQNRKLKENELYFLKYPVKSEHINKIIPEQFFEMVTDDEDSRHNIKLVHSYVMLRKVELIPAEKWFLLKDFGRSGKGYFMKTFENLLKVTQVNFDSLSNSGGFEASNEWLKFYGADLAHANETDEINNKNMRILRKIATSEEVTGRQIGQDTLTFKNRAVLVLDTNENVDTGEITANKSRTVKVSFKDRPKEETDEERHAAFKPYWDFLQPGGHYSLAAGISFMISSLESLKEIGGTFFFKDVTLKNFFSADEFTQTQEILLETIARQGFIRSGDEALQAAIRDDYGSLRYHKAKQDIKNIGVVLNRSKRIEGAKMKINTIGNEKVFNNALKLWQQNQEI